MAHALVAPLAAAAEARVYASAGFHGVMIEKTHDRPYLKGAVGPEIVESSAGSLLRYTG